MGFSSIGPIVNHHTQWAKFQFANCEKKPEVQHLQRGTADCVFIDPTMWA